jgi:NAD kinase
MLQFKFENVVVITRKTALEELVERFNTREQARFYVEHLGTSFAGYQSSHDTYHTALHRLRADLREHLPELRTQFVERAFLPNYQFGDHDIVVTLGPDGLVVNTAKYLAGQPLVAINPDPQRMDGVLLPFTVPQALPILRAINRGKFRSIDLRMARAELPDGQSLLAVNDLFIGAKTHISARYRMRYRGQEEDQSSSGVIVSTGAGSTGWYRSVLAGAVGLVEAAAPHLGVGPIRDRYRFDATADELRFCVREPFVSRVSAATLVTGRLGPGETLELTSQMPQNGVIFSDGVESDFLRFDTGTTARIGLADRRACLVQA